MKLFIWDESTDYSYVYVAMAENVDEAREAILELFKTTDFPDIEMADAREDISNPPTNIYDGPAAADYFGVWT